MYKRQRLDSGDLAYLSIEARKMLDEAGFPDCSIVASNSLDEYLIREMLEQGAQVDLFGVGERLITSSSDPVFGGVYKLAAVEDKGRIVPKIKLSENVGKITTPGFKEVWRLYENETGKAIADVVTLHDEVISSEEPYVLFDPEFTWKSKTVSDFTAKPIRQLIFEGGKLVYSCPNVHQIRTFCQQQVETLWDEVKRFENPHTYYVDLSKSLWEEKQLMLAKYKR